MIRRSLRSSIPAIATAALLLSACQQAKHEVKKVAGREVPQVRATVVTIQTTVQPGNRTSTHSLVIGPDFARSTSETGTYRLFDVKQNRVLFVNEFAKSFRSEPLQSLLATRNAASLAPLVNGQPRATFETTPATRTIAGVAARQSVVRLGAYQRELWIGSHPAIPPQLFAMVTASTPTVQSEPVQKDVDLALVAVRGYPLLDHSEVPYGAAKIVVDRQVVSVQQKNVPLSLVVLPSGYTDVTPQPKAPGERRPGASSRPRDRKTPGAGSPLSSTGQTVP